MQKSIVLLLVGCAALTQAVETSSLRTKLKSLAQLQARQMNATDCDDDLPAPELGDLSGDLLDWCPEQLGANAPAALGSALSASALQSVALSQSQQVSSVPDTMQNTTVQALSNACNAAAHAEESEATRIRTFDISGQVCVEENVRYKEKGEVRERSQGASEKLGVLVVSNEGSDDSTDLGTLAACGDEGIQYEAPSH